MLSNFVFQFIDLEVGLPVIMHHIVVFFSQLPEALVYFTTHLQQRSPISPTFTHLVCGATQTLGPRQSVTVWTLQQTGVQQRVPCEGRRGQRQRDGGCNVTQIVATASTCNGSTYAKTTDGAQDASWIVPSRTN